MFNVNNEDTRTTPAGNCQLGWTLIIFAKNEFLEVFFKGFLLKS